MFHAIHPESPGPKDEYQLARKQIAKWRRAFPEAIVTIGNHDERVTRKAAAANIPSFRLRPYHDIWDTPRWKWVYDTIIDDVFYFHGTNTSGLNPAYNSMVKRLMSVVQEHNHNAAGIKWRASPQRRTFGMDIGCGIDDTAAAFAYRQGFAARSILSAGVVIDGIPYHHVMPMGPGEKYHKSKFGRRACTSMARR